MIGVRGGSWGVEARGASTKSVCTSHLAHTAPHPSSTAASGTGGAALKRLGSEARKEIETFLGRPVFLEISVQVAPDWRQHSERLKEYGYYDPLYIA